MSDPRISITLNKVEALENDLDLMNERLDQLEKENSVLRKYNAELSKNLKLVSEVFEKRLCDFDEKLNFFKSELSEDCLAKKIQQKLLAGQEKLKASLDKQCTDFAGKIKHVDDEASRKHRVFLQDFADLKRYTEKLGLSVEQLYLENLQQDHHQESQLEQLEKKVLGVNDNSERLYQGVLKELKQLKELLSCSALKLEKIAGLDTKEARVVFASLNNLLNEVELDG